MEHLLFLMAGLVAVVFAAVFRRTNSRALSAVRTIEVTDRTIARSMLVDHADAFSNRPASPFPVKFVRSERVNLSYSISTAPHGQLWRALRCNLTAGIFHPTRLGLVDPLQRETIDGLIASLSSGCRQGGGHKLDVVVRGSLHTAVLTLLTRLCFGDGSFDEHDARAVQRVINDFFDGMVYAPVLATSRVARLLHWRRWRRFLGIRSRMAKLLLPLMAERQRQRALCGCGSDDNGRGGGGIVPYVDSLLDLEVPSYDDASVRRALTDDEKVTLVWEFLNAGTETIVSCVEWTLAHLVIQPEVQNKLRREVDGGGDLHKADTPYLRAVVLESLRLHPPMPVTRDVVVGGDAAFFCGQPLPEDDSIRKVMRYYIDSGAIGRDSTAWTDPDVFRPERFLAGGEAESVGPMPGPKDMRMLPFGAGTRHCPGRGLAMSHVSLVVAALVRGFQWGLPAAKGGGLGLVDLTEQEGFVKHMKTPLKARITPLKAHK